MNEITVPREFHLLGSKWRVKKVKNLTHHDEFCHGLTDPNTKLIKIDAAAFDDEDLLIHTFMHELDHAIDHCGGYEDDCANEEKTDLRAGLRQQAFKSSKKELK